MSASLSDLLAAKRQELLAQKGKTMVLPVPGYEGLLYARYKPLPFEEIRRIQMNHEGIGTNPVDEVNAAADMLVQACEELLEKVDGEFKSLGHQWNVRAANALFGANIADTATSRSALKAIFADDSNRIMEHFGAFMTAARDVEDEVAEVMKGEPEPSVEGSSNSALAQPSLVSQ